MNQDKQFVPQEVAYLVQNMRGTAKWQRKLVKTEAAFDKLMAKLSEQGAEILTRDADGGLTRSVTGGGAS